MEILLQDLLPGQEYLIQLRAKNQNGASQWSRSYSFTTSSDVIAPSPITSLSWSVSNTSFVGSWTAPTTDSDGGDLRDFKDFKVTLTASAVDVVFYVTEPRFDLSLSRNIASWGSPKPSVAIKVEARDTIGNLSTPVTASATNGIPEDVTGFDSTSALGGVNLVWNNVSDTDLKQYEIYVAGTSGFTPGPSNLKIVTTANSAFYATDVLALQYYKIRAVDAFNQGSANYAVESQVAYPLDGVPDTTAPSQPSAPTVSTGTLVAQVSHAMTKQSGGNLEADVDYLEIHASTTTGFTPSSSTLRGTIDSAGQGIGVSAAFYFPTTDSMTNLYWKVIAVDRSKNKSSASNQATGLPNLIQNANILNATITDAKIQNLSAAKLQAGTAIINDLFIQSDLTVSDVGTIQSENFVAGVSGWQIAANGSAEFNGVVVRGELFVDGDSGFEYIRVYQDLGLPTLEWSSDSGYVWESYAADWSTGPDVSFMKITNNNGGIFWMNTGEVCFVGGNLGAPGVAHDPNVGFLKHASAFLPTEWEEWNNIPGANGWSGGKYKLMPDGTVHLDGQISGGTTTAGILTGTLPTGYRPLMYQEFMVSRSGAYGTSKITIETNGDIKYWANDGVWNGFLAGIVMHVI